MEESTKAVGIEIKKVSVAIVLLKEISKSERESVERIALSALGMSLKDGDSLEVVSIPRDLVNDNDLLESSMEGS